MEQASYPALARFLEARSAVAGRASLALPDPPEGAPALERGAALSAYLTDCLDAAVAELARGIEGVAVVAVGGYGRGELARHSDVDLMLLVDGGAEDRAVRMLYPLWDASLKVGHSVRTVSESVEAAKANIETYTSLLDARLVAGDLAPFHEFIEARRKLVRGSRPWLREQLVDLRAERVRAEPWQLLAVDVKTSRGGLRGLHALHWLAAAEAIAEDRDEPHRSGALAEAHEALTLTRHAVHALVDRPNDTYRPEYAREVGDWLGVDSFEWGRSLYAHMRVVDAAVADAFAVEERPRRRWWSRRRANVEEPDDRSTLAALRRTLEGIAPGGLLEPLGLQQGGEPSWLATLLPEWEALRARPHIAPFHIHPVDVHTARTVAEARHVMQHDEFGARTPEVAAAFAKPEEVLLAALLHDIGKAHAGVEHPAAGAVIAERFATRAGLGAVTQRLVAAVRHHLLLPAVATRRDIADAEVIRETAEAVGDLDTLRLLYVLAVADARASGPNVWNQWKAQLMRALFDRVSAVLEQRAHAPSSEAVAEALAGRFPPEVVRAHLAGLDASYLLSTPPETVGDQIALIEQAATAEGRSAARRETLGEIDRVTLVTPDRPGLLQDIAGTLAGFNASMLGGVAYTRADGIAIQVWHVGDALNRDGRNGANGGGIDDRRWSRILDALPRAACGEFDIEERLDEVRRSYPQPPRRADIETKVSIDNAASRDYSVLEVSAPDRRGLLYAVTKALHDLRIDIHLAKVDTIGPEVFDAFYIRRENGSRIEEPDEVARLVARIEGVLAELG